jgi:thiamine-monophosphate kinase
MLSRITGAVPMDRARAFREGLRLGIGDDSALLAPKRNSETVLSSDFFIEDSHFIAREHPPESIGYKALARAVSDLAAMGAEPAFFLLNVAMPAAKTGEWFDGFLRGLGTAARKLRISLIGGDLSAAKTVAVCVTVLGYARAGRSVRRSGATPGDLIFVSGRLGAARLGLEIVRKRLQRSTGAKQLLRTHLYPEIRLELGSWLARNRIASAMMDISDGLSLDLARLCEASRAGARIEAARIPKVKIPSDWRKRLHPAESSELEFALHGGDDYELLFTVPPRNSRRLWNAPGRLLLTDIGEVTRDRRIRITDEEGRERALPALGWDHFAK